MEKAGNDLLKTDEAIKAEIASLKTQFEDTPAIGQSKGQVTGDHGPDDAQEP